MKTHSDFDLLLAGHDWYCYTWGEIQAIHKIGNYAILEYISNSKEHERLFHPIIWTDEFKQYHNNEFYWDDTNHSYYSLDAAIIGVIAYKHDGANSQAAGYFCKMIGI